MKPLLQAWSAFRNTNPIIKILLLSSLALFVVCLSCALSGVTAAYRVHYGDQYIGTVRSKSDFEAARSTVSELLANDGVTDYLYDASYDVVLTCAKDLTSAEGLTASILENTDEVTYAVGILIDGVQVAVVADAGDFAAYQAAALEQYKTGAADETVELLSEVKSVAGYYAVTALSDADALAEAAAQLRVQTIHTETTETEIAYQKETKDSGEKQVGYQRIITAGQNGLSVTTEKVIYINGQETARETVSTEVVKEPVNQVTLVGTKAVQKTVVAQKASASGFVWPLARAERMQFSCYFGDGGHKGLDIAVPANTQIYAVKAGTIVIAAYSPSYGNYIVIDHGNGLQTLYAHSSKLLVSVGQTVEAGQTIALVGSTGNSTGNHLHIEVCINGTRVDPAPYLGLS